MPTEHEYKYLLDRSQKTIKQVDKLASSITYIEQGYLTDSKGVTVRIRHSQKEKKSIWTMTTKIDTTERVVEIEQELDERDAKDLWQRCYSKLRKVRHHLHDDKGRLWEVDVFLIRVIEKNEDKCYCVLAEIELPEKAPRPSDLPDFITENLLYAVPLGDGKFSNKKLWKVAHTNGLYEKLRKK